jgi:TRAP-type mannitol/chloroaromatic compound transport system permease small subunit
MKHIQLQQLTHFLSIISSKTGHWLSWLTLVMVVLLCINVLSSWLLQQSSILLSESINWLHSANFLLAAAYTLNRNQHVRVDIFYAKMSHKAKAAVDFFGTLLLLIPFAFFILWSSWSYVALSFRINEVSAEAGGMPYLFIFKGFLLIMPILLLIEALNQLLVSVIRYIKPHTSQGES